MQYNSLHCLLRQNNTWRRKFPWECKKTARGIRPDIPLRGSFRSESQTQGRWGCVYCGVPRQGSLGNLNMACLMVCMGQFYVIISILKRLWQIVTWHDIKYFIIRCHHLHFHWDYRQSLTILSKVCLKTINNRVPDPDSRYFIKFSHWCFKTLGLCVLVLAQE